MEPNNRITTFRVVLNNIMLFSQWVILIIGLRPFRCCGIPILSWIWGATFVLAEGYLLRKHMCTHCPYYGKLCPYGWGKLLPLMFPRKSGNEELGFKIHYLLHVVMGVIIPLFLIGGHAFLFGRPHHWLLFTIWIGLVIANVPLRRTNCSVCLRRNSCPIAASILEGRRLPPSGNLHV